MSGLGPSFMKILTCGSSPRSGSRNTWTRIKNVKVVWAILKFFRCDPNNFLSRLFTMDETWLYHYDPKKKQQSMEWWHSGSARPAPKNSKCKNPLEGSSSGIFGIKTASSSLIIFQRTKLSTRSITHHCWCNWRIFWRKNAAGSSPRGVVLAWVCPGSPGTCNPEETGLPGIQCLGHQPYFPELAPSDYHLFPGLKKQLESCLFSSDAEGIPTAET